MRNEWKHLWGWRVSAVVLAVGLLALGTGAVVTQAGTGPNRFVQEYPTGAEVGGPSPESS